MFDKAMKLLDLFQYMALDIMYPDTEEADSCEDAEFKYSDAMIMWKKSLKKSLLS